MYHHKVLRVNFITYDMRRTQDSLNPRIYADIIMHVQHDDNEELECLYSY